MTRNDLKYNKKVKRDCRTDRPTGGWTDGWTDGPTKRGVESCSIRLKIGKCFYLKSSPYSNKIDRESKFDDFLSFGAKQNALQKVFFQLWSLKSFLFL